MRERSRQHLQESAAGEKIELVGQLEISHRTFIEKQYDLANKILDTLIAGSTIATVDLVKNPGTPHAEILLSILGLGLTGAVVARIVEKVKMEKKIKTKESL